MRLPPIPSWAPWSALGAAIAAALFYAVRPPGGGGPVWEGGGGFGGGGPSPDGPSGPVDPYAPWETTKEGDCDPTPKPGVLAFRKWILAKFGQAPKAPQNIIRDCAIGGPSEHKEGRGWDIMTNSIDHGQSIVDFLMAPDPVTGEPHALARRAGIMYAIWDHKMWRAYPWQGQPSGSWEPYTKGEAASPHTDHIHFSFSWAGAKGETSLYPWLASQPEANV